MKRRDLIVHLESHGCRPKREGSNHSIFENPANGRGTAVPRHREINNFTARKLCDDLDIPHPSKK